MREPTSTRYRTIVADPPWEMPGGGGRRGGLPRLPYPSMTVDAIAELPVNEFAASQSHIFVWTFDRYVVDGSTTRVIETWGFTVLPRMFVWRKASAGLGMAVRPVHELIMVGRRGSKGFRSTAPSVLTVQDWKQPYANGKIHSAKPDGMQDMVEALCDGPYLELFARRQRLGWDTWGNEALEHVVMESA